VLSIVCIVSCAGLVRLFVAQAHALCGMMLHRAAPPSRTKTRGCLSPMHFLSQKYRFVAVRGEFETCFFQV
jgi:hypothetical protein